MTVSPPRSPETVAHFVLRSAGRSSVLMAVLGLASAAINGTLIATVHQALDPRGHSRELALRFIALGVGKVVLAYLSARSADTYAQRSVALLRHELTVKLLAMPYRAFERLGTGRALAVLTSDVAVINAALQSTATILVNTAILAGGAAYLAYLDLAASLAVMVVVALGFLVYRAMGLRARAELRQARAAHDRFFQHVNAAMLGAKELRMHARRRAAFLLGPLSESTRTMAAHDLSAQSRYLAGQAANSLLVLVMIGLALFVLPGRYGLGTPVVSGYVLAGLYLMGPLSALLRLSPLYEAAAIALRRVTEIGDGPGQGALDPGAAPDARPSFTAIELRGVGYRYDADGFVLGPVSLSLAPGEILFIAGDNGSGKSTLAKLLCGLYEPSAGALLWNGREVVDSERDLYRQLWSAVFADFHLFDRFYGLDAPDLQARASAWSSELGLASVVRFEHGVPSSLELSLGQRKRLGLLTALLEDRPLYLFDEWAAEQDAEFKERFYRTLLPSLRTRGKTVVVISHDERFFDIADRVISLAEGRPSDRTATAALTGISR